LPIATWITAWVTVLECEGSYRVNLIFGKLFFLAIFFCVIFVGFFLEFFFVFIYPNTSI
jgi:hypothetical protein